MVAAPLVDVLELVDVHDVAYLVRYCRDEQSELHNHKHYYDPPLQPLLILRVGVRVVVDERQLVKL